MMDLWQLLPIFNELNKANRWYRVYNQGGLINVLDDNGVIQSIYPSTGTICLHRSNDKSDHEQVFLKGDDGGIAVFIYYLLNPHVTQDMFSAK